MKNDSDLSVRVSGEILCKRREGEGARWSQSGKSCCWFCNFRLAGHPPATHSSPLETVESFSMRDSAIYCNREGFPGGIPCLIPNSGRKWKEECEGDSEP